MSAVDPHPCADCGDAEHTIYYERDGEWACDEPSLCMERQRDQAAEQLRGAVAAIREAPHAGHCEAASSMWPGPCTCWKRKWAEDRHAGAVEA